MENPNEREKRLPNIPRLPEIHSSVDHSYGLEHKNIEQTGISRLLNTKEGYILGRINDEPLKINTDGHLLTIGPTRAGKGIGIVVPNILSHTGSLLVIDVKGENLKKTAWAKRLQGHRVVVLDPYNQTEGAFGYDSFNPLDRYALNTNDKQTDAIIKQIVHSLMYDKDGRKSSEPIWDNATIELVSGLLQLCLRKWAPNRRNFFEIYKVLQYTEEETKEFAKELYTIIENEPNEVQAQKYKSLYNFFTADREKTKIPDNAITQARMTMAWVVDTAFHNQLNHSTFSFADMHKEKMAIYLVVPEDFMAQCAVWVRLIFENAAFAQPYTEDIYGVSSKNLNQDQRLLFVLDELPLFGKLEVIEKGVGTLAGRGINLWMLAQSQAQIEAIYGKPGLTNIRQNVAVLQAFKLRAVSELEYFVKLIGEELHLVETINISETQTESTAINESRTLTFTKSNSESISESKSESFNQSRGQNWNESFGKSVAEAKGTNWSKTQGEQVGRSTNWQKGAGRSFNKGSGETFQRGLLWSSKINDSINQSKAKNYNESKGGGSNFGYNTSSTNGGNETITYSQNNQASKGGQENYGYTSQTGKTKTKQSGTSESDATTKGTTHTKAKALQRGISVTTKRMPIETIRSIRQKIMQSNQLLYIDDDHPFFVPSMSFIQKYADKNRYMFPDFVVMSNLHTFNEIANRKGLIEPIKNGNAINSNTLQKAHEYSKTWKKNKNSPPLAASYYKMFFSDDLPKIVKHYKNIQIEIAEQRNTFSEVAVMLLTMFSVLKSLGYEEYFNDDIELINRMVEIEQLDAKDYDVPPLLKPYKEIQLVKDHSLKNQQLISRMYSPLVAKFFEDLNTVMAHIEITIKTQERVRQWLLSSTRKIYDSLENVFIDLDERDDNKRQAFMKEYRKIYS